MNSIDEIRKGIEYGFIDNAVEAGEQYKPKLVTNQDGETVLDYLYSELDTAKSFIFAVAFVTEGGLVTLKSRLNDLNAIGIKGKLITSNYLNFNDPKVFKELLKIPNLDVKIINEEGFHTKAYSFEHEGYRSVIIGSANLTQTALQKNFEWNLLTTSLVQGGLTQQIQARLDNLWETAEPLTQKWIDTYEQIYKQIPYQNIYKVREYNNVLAHDLIQIAPNEMQLPALMDLQATRANGEKKGLVVAATGTGKTYLAAFDVQNVAPDKFLFVVHREQILNQALASFKKVLGGDDSDYGLLSGSQRKAKAKYLFATINMISKPELMAEFGADYFDYIIIDEAHRVGFNDDQQSETMYQRFMNFFKPDFMLGMTATPERTDGKHVYEYFDYNVVHNISLVEALDAELLAPFHYIGVSDYEKDGEIIDDSTQLKNLVSNERVAYILEKTTYYGYSGDILRGLIFVSRVEEGQLLAAELTKQGHKSRFIYGEDKVETRFEAVEQLQNAEIEYIITVDVFNEGVDIPEINQVIMMRPTVSSIIFLQQLGRGLRKVDDKEYVTIIDFIGNYANNYMIPMAFDKSRSANKEKIRKNVIAPTLTGVSTINFEEVARKRVLKAVGDFKPDSMKRFEDAYKLLKDQIGHKVPMLQDFENMGAVEITDIIAKFKSLSLYQIKFDDVDALPKFTESQQAFLKYIYGEITSSKRILEVETLAQLIQKGSLSEQEVIKIFADKQYFYDEQSLGNVKSVLDTTYFMARTLKNYGDPKPLLEMNGDEWTLGNEFKHELLDDAFKRYVKDAIEAGKQHILENFDVSVRFTRYEKYDLRDVIKGLNWGGEQVPLNVGGYLKKPDETALPIFVKLEKLNLTNAVAYEDRFISRDTFNWLSKNNRTLQSKTEKWISEVDNYDIIQLFVKKSDEIAIDGPGYYYLGPVKPLFAEDTTQNDAEGNAQRLVRYDFKLENAVDASLYKALTE
ncbi:MAG: DEAD/DEAH box helicase [Lactobacillaceae bacterium]|jgi:superfamily II DNA or RNA helicase/HKD family nuclease|nr:DEAD/DEAH box helicase [Lactobacillaceae bacterium]